MLAILTLIFAFIFAPAAIPLGVVARRQIRHTGEDGDGLALAGLIVGIVFTALWLLMLLLIVPFFTAAYVATNSGSAPAPLPS